MKSRSSMNSMLGIAMMGAVLGNVAISRRGRNFNTFCENVPVNDSESATIFESDAISIRKAEEKRARKARKYAKATASA